MDIKDKVNYMVIHNDNYDYHYEDYDGHVYNGFTNIIFNESTNKLIFVPKNWNIQYDKDSGISIEYVFSSDGKINSQTSLFKLNPNYCIVYVSINNYDNEEDFINSLYNINDDIKSNNDQIALQYILTEIFDADLLIYDDLNIVIKTSKIIHFEDPLVKQICVNNWGGHYVDGEITEYEAAQVSYFDQRFQKTAITKFNELKYFTGIMTFQYENSSGNSYGTSTANSYSVGQFYKCSSLTEVTLPEMKVPTCICGMFRECTSLTKLDLSPLTKNFGLHGATSSVCWGCTSLEEIIMPSGQYNITNLTTNMYMMFRSCTSLKRIIFNRDVDFGKLRYTTYGDYRCSKCTEIIFNGTVSGLGNTNSEYTCYYFHNYPNLNRISMLKIISGMNVNVNNKIVYFYNFGIKNRLYSEDCQEAINRGWTNLWKILYINGIKYEHWLCNYNSTTSIRIGTNITLSNLQNFTFNNNTRVLSFPIKCGALSMDLSCQTGQNFTIGLSGVDLYDISRNVGIIFYTEHACTMDSLIIDVVENEAGSISYVGSNSTVFSVQLINSFGATMANMGMSDYGNGYSRLIYAHTSSKSTNIQTHIELSDFYCPKGSLILIQDRTAGATLSYSISTTQNSSLEDIFINGEYWYVDYGICIEKIIDTEIIPTIGMRMRAEFILYRNPYNNDPDPTQKHMIMGSIQGGHTGTGFFQIYASSAKEFTMAWAHNSVTKETYTNRVVSGAVLDGVSHDITIDKNGFTIYCPTYNGTESKTFSGTVIENNVDYHLLLYPCIWLHRLRIWNNIDSTPTLIHEIVGVRNNLNSKEGLYDLITGKFWTTKYDNYEVEV